MKKFKFIKTFNNIIYKMEGRFKYDINDNLNKHKKEKDLDKYLLKAEIARAKDVNKQIEHYEKIYEVKFLKKRKRSDEKESTKNKEEDKQVSQEENKKEVDVKFALEKIIKHLDKPASLGKCLSLLKKLFISYKINQVVTLKIFLKVSSLPHKYADDQNKKDILELFKFAFSNQEETKDQDAFYSKMISLFDIPFKDEISLITDDSFQFNKMMKSIENKFSKLPDYTPTENSTLNIFNQSLTDENVYSVNTIDELLSNCEIEKDILLSAMERNFLFLCLRRSFMNSKHKWAAPSISNLFTTLILEKSKLSDDQIKELESLLGQIKNKGVTSTLQDSNVVLRDEKTKNNPLESYHKVTDARKEITTFDSSHDRWGAKQSGLTYGKMYINN